MNKYQYILLLGPALGFVLGLFLSWFISYSRTKLIETKASETENKLQSKISELEMSVSNLKSVEARLDESNNLVSNLENKLKESLAELHSEIEARSALEEKVKNIEILEKNIEELKKSEHEAIQCQEKLSATEASLSEIRKNLSDKQSEIEEFKVRLDNLGDELTEAKDKNADLAILSEKVKTLEEAKRQLMLENEQLRAMKDQLSQLDEIKQMYGKTLAENHILKNQDLAKHFVEIKGGLEQSIKAYNKMLNLIDDPAITDNKVIEIEAASVSNSDEEDKSEEEILDEVPENTDELSKLDGDVCEK